MEHYWDWSCSAGVLLMVVVCVLVIASAHLRNSNKDEISPVKERNTLWNISSLNWLDVEIFTSYDAIPNFDNVVLLSMYVLLIIQVSYFPLHSQTGFEWSQIKYCPITQILVTFKHQTLKNITIFMQLDFLILIFFPCES